MRQEWVNLFGADRQGGRQELLGIQKAKENFWAFYCGEGFMKSGLVEKQASDFTQGGRAKQLRQGFTWLAVGLYSPGFPAHTLTLDLICFLHMYYVFP